MPSFRDIIKIQRDASEEDAIVPDWDVEKCIFCNIINTGGGEKIRGKQLESNTKFAVETRYTCNLDSGMRIIVMSGAHKNKVLNIHTVTVIERRRPLRPHLMILQCSESS